MGFVGGHLPEIIIVLVVILIIWGPGKLPDVGAAMGKGIREFRQGFVRSSRRRGGHDHHHAGAAGTCGSDRRRTGAGTCAAG